MFKNFSIVFLILLFSCDEQKEISSINPVNWDSRTVKTQVKDSLIKGSTYLSVYSEIYSQTEHATINLTATVSLRNINKTDTVYLNKASYYSTSGELIRDYFSKTIFIAPMETVEIVIDERDNSGGSGANFIFDWEIKPNSHEPFFESAMISTYGQQGLSFTTQGIRIN